MARVEPNHRMQDSFTGGWSMVFPHRAPEELWTVAADVEAYPRFVPWCREARILRRLDGQRLKVDNVYGTGPVRFRFRTIAELDPPRGLVIRSNDGPFRAFRLAWRFQSLPEGGCEAAAAFEARLHSNLLQSLMRLSWREAERRIIDAFRRRVVELYGNE